MTESAALSPKTHSYLTMKIKKQKASATRKCDIKRKVEFEDYQICLEPTQRENKISLLEKKT